MPAHFEAIKEQMRADLVAVLGDEATIKFGQPRKPIRTYPHAVVRSGVSRANTVRQVKETYGFEIDLRLPLPDADVADIESYLYAKADELVMRLAPYDLNDVPESVGPYAGVGTLRHVSEVLPGDEKDADAFCSVKIGFSCMTTIYQ